jgi:hypothetical protein
MKILPPLLLAAACVAAGATNVSASCLASGVSTQSVSLSSGGKNIERWQVKPDEIHRNRLANGFELGLKIEPATTEKYAELFERTKSKAFDELVKISVYDMGGAEPKLLTHTWGGANSKQGYGPRGGADGVPAIGEPGIELWLHKPACVTKDDLAKLK